MFILCIMNNTYQDQIINTKIKWTTIIRLFRMLCSVSTISIDEYNFVIYYIDDYFVLIVCYKR